MPQRGDWRCCGSRLLRRAPWRSHSWRGGTDLHNQRAYVERMVAGERPFRDFFPEYPPLVFLYTGLPALVDPSLRSYAALFRILSCAVDCGTWAIVLRGNRNSVSQPLLYLLCTTALGPLLYDRIDIALGAMLAAALLSLLRGREGLFKLFVGLGIAFKLIPIVLAPAIVARAWRRSAHQPARRTMEARSSPGGQRGCEPGPAPSRSPA